MGLVRQSASCAFEFTQRIFMFSPRRSRTSKHSRVVRYSAHVGIAVREQMSKTDLQSVTVTAVGIHFRADVGFFHESSGWFIHFQNSLIQLSLSKVLLSAIVSALSVDLTTRGIFLDVHAIGQTGALSLALSALVVLNISVP